MLRAVHRTHPSTDLDVVTLPDTDVVAAVTMPARTLADGVEAARVLDEPIQLLTGPGHPLATARAAFYADLAAAFGLTMDVVGPNFGTEALLDAVADSAAVATFVGEQTRLLWPADYDLRRIPVRDPTPVYPHSLIWRADNPHPTLAALRDHLGGLRSDGTNGTDGTWTPPWARQAVEG